MNAGLDDARCLSGAALAAALQDSRARTRAWTFDLDPAQWLPPEQAGVNPIAWELAHLAWFAEFWVLRGPHRVDQAGRVHAARPARIAGPDALFDSARLPHAGRWRAPLPARDELADRLDAQLDAGLAALAACDQDDDAALYVHRLALFHEDMHGEAFAWMRAALGWPAPAGVALPRVAASGTLQLPAAEVAIGWPAGRRGFAFDNEASAHRVALPAFEIDAEPVSAGRYLEFVEAGGYAQSRWWPGEAGRWRAQQPHPHPARWRRAAQWQQRWFDRWLPLDPQQPAMHLSAWEAEAFARWAGRRLPSAAEWEHAALARPETFRWGHGVWEWTASPFQPYPGFEPGPYRDYSAPWFGDHRELRGGAFATHARLHHPRYRNFFQPARTDVFAGFRTAAS